MASTPSAIQVPIEGDFNPLIQGFTRIANQLPNLRAKIDPSQYNTAVGSMSRATSDFGHNLERAEARVLSLGLAGAALYNLQRAFTEVIKSTIDVEKRLAEINVIMGASNNSIKEFGSRLFDIARNTGQSFDEVSKAALEFSRQGLGMQETLKRTNDALVLTRQTGIGASESVEAITAAMNSFSKAAYDSTQIINKLAKVDQDFAVSGRDIIEAIKRVGSTAEDAGVSLDQLIALVTSTKQITQREGAQIGQAFKTIFTRLQRPSVINDLEDMGVKVRDAKGNMLGAVDVLSNLAKAYDNFNTAQKSAATELVGNLYQINILKAELKDLNSEYSNYNRALNDSKSATDEASTRNAKLNQTLAALVNTTKANFTQLASTIGGDTLAPSIRKVLGAFNLAAEFTNKTLAGGKSDSTWEVYGASIGKGILTGLGNFISGPGLFLAGTAIYKLIQKFTSYLPEIKKTLFDINTSLNGRNIEEGKLPGILSRELEQYQQLRTSDEARAAAAVRILEIINAQTAALNKQVAATQALSKILVNSGLVATEAAEANILAAATPKGPSTPKKASKGYVPNFVDPATAAMERAGAYAAGYTPGPVQEYQGKIINGAEMIVNSPAHKESAIVPPVGSPAFRKFNEAYGMIYGKSVFGGIEKGRNLFQIQWMKSKARGAGKDLNDPDTILALGKEFREIYGSNQGLLPFSQGFVPNYAYIPGLTPLIGRIATNITHSGQGFSTNAFEPAIEYVKAFGIKSALKRTLIQDKPLYNISDLVDKANAKFYTDKYGVMKGKETTSGQKIERDTPLFKLLFGEHSDSFFGHRQNEGEYGVSDFAFRKMFGLQPRIQPNEGVKMRQIPGKKNVYAITSDRGDERMLNLVRDSNEERSLKNENNALSGYATNSSDFGNFNIFTKPGGNQIRFSDTWDFALHDQKELNYGKAFKELKTKFINPEQFKNLTSTLKSFRHADPSEIFSAVKGFDYKSLFNKDFRYTDLPEDLRDMPRSITSYSASYFTNLLRHAVSKVTSPITFVGQLGNSSDVVTRLRNAANANANFEEDQAEYRLSPEYAEDVKFKLSDKMVRLRRGIVRGLLDKGYGTGFKPATERTDKLAFPYFSGGEPTEDVAFAHGYIPNFAKLYNTDVYIPPELKEQLKSLIGQNIVLAQITSHARQAVLDDVGKFGKSAVGQIPTKFSFNPEEVFEIETEGGQTFGKTSISKLGISKDVGTKLIRKLVIRPNSSNAGTHLASLVTTWGNDVEDKHATLDKSRYEQPPKSRGFIPNFASPLGEAIQREMAAGLSIDKIRVGTNQALISPANPLGLGVSNTRDEPAGLQQGVNRALLEGKSPKAYGSVPNFALESTRDLLSNAGQSQRSIDTLFQYFNSLVEELKGNQIAFSEMTAAGQKVVDAMVKQAQGIGLNDEELRKYTNQIKSSVAQHIEIDRQQRIAAAGPLQTSVQLATQKVGTQYEIGQAIQAQVAKQAAVENRQIEQQREAERQFKAERAAKQAAEEERASYTAGATSHYNEQYLLAGLTNSGQAKDIFEKELRQRLSAQKEKAEFSAGATQHYNEQLFLSQLAEKNRQKEFQEELKFQRQNNAAQAYPFLSTAIAGNAFTEEEKVASDLGSRYRGAARTSLSTRLNLRNFGSEAYGKFKDNAFTVSYLAPIAAGIAQQSIGDQTGTKRGLSASVGAAGNAISFAALGAQFNPYAAAGLGIGSTLLELPKVIQAFTDKLPELQKNLEALTETATRTSDGFNKFINLGEQLKEVYNNPQPGYTKTVQRLRGEQLSSLLQIDDPKARAELLQGYVSGSVEKQVAAFNKYTGIDSQKVTAASINTNLTKTIQENPNQISDIQKEQLQKLAVSLFTITNKEGKTLEEYFQTHNEEFDAFMKNLSIISNSKNPTSGNLVKGVVDTFAGGYNPEQYKRFADAIATASKGNVGQAFASALSGVTTKEYLNLELQARTNLNKNLLDSNKAIKTFADNLLDMREKFTKFLDDLNGATGVFLAKMQGINERLGVYQQQILARNTPFLTPEQGLQLKGQLDIDKIVSETQIALRTSQATSYQQLADSIVNVALQGIKEFQPQIESKRGTIDIGLPQQASSYIQNVIDAVEKSLPDKQDWQSVIEVARQQLGTVNRKIATQSGQEDTVGVTSVELRTAQNVLSDIILSGEKGLREAANQQTAILEQKTQEIRTTIARNALDQDALNLQRQVNFGGGIGNLTSGANIEDQLAKIRDVSYAGKRFNNVELQSDAALSQAQLFKSLNIEVPQNIREILQKRAEEQVRQVVPINENTRNAIKTAIDTEFPTEKSPEQLNKIREQYSNLSQLELNKQTAAFKPVLETASNTKNIANILGAIQKSGITISNLPKNEEKTKDTFIPENDLVSKAPLVDTESRASYLRKRIAASADIRSDLQSQYIEKIDKYLNQPIQPTGTFGPGHIISQHYTSSQVEQLPDVVALSQSIDKFTSQIKDAQDELDFLEKFQSFDKYIKEENKPQLNTGTPLASSLSTNANKKDIDDFVASFKAYTNALNEQNKINNVIGAGPQALEFKRGIGYDAGGRSQRAANTELATTESGFARGETLSNKDLRDNAIAAAGGFYTANEAAVDLQRTILDTSKTMRDSFKQAAAEMITGSKTVSQAFREMGLSIANRFLTGVSNTAIDSLLGVAGAGLTKALGASDTTGKSILDIFAGKHAGGYIPKYADGGVVTGGSGIKDDVFANLQGGEYVINKDAAQKLGYGFLDDLNTSYSGAGAGAQASQLSASGNSLQARLQDAYLYEGPDLSRPRGSNFAVDPRLSTLALLDPNNPQNQLREQRTSIYSQYEIGNAQARTAYNKALRDFNQKIRLQAGLTVGTAAVNAGVGFYNQSGNSLVNSTGSVAGADIYNFNNANYALPNEEYSAPSDIYTGASGSPAFAHSGGFIQRFARGGYNAMLTGGEYVMSPQATAHIGVSRLNTMNAGVLPKFATGGLVSDVRSSVITGTSGNDSAITHLSKLVELSTAIRDALQNTNKQDKQQKDNQQQQQAGPTNNVNITINVNNTSSGTNVTSSTDVNTSNNSSGKASDQQKMAQLAKMMKDTATSVIIQEQRPGGLLYDSKTRTNSTS